MIDNLDSDHSARLKIKVDNSTQPSYNKHIAANKQEHKIDFPTTTQARKAMRKAGLSPLYTNKTTGHTGEFRRVKAYYTRGADIAALQESVGVENVRVTNGAELSAYGRDGVIVYCVLG